MNNNKKNKFNSDYDRDVLPLVDKLYEMCKKHNFDFAIAVAPRSEPNDDSFMARTSGIYKSGEAGFGLMKLLAMLMDTDAEKLSGLQSEKHEVEVMDSVARVLGYCCLYHFMEKLASRFIDSQRMILTGGALARDMNVSTRPLMDALRQAIEKKVDQANGGGDNWDDFFCRVNNGDSDDG